MNIGIICMMPIWGHNYFIGLLANKSRSFTGYKVQSQESMRFERLKKL